MSVGLWHFLSQTAIESIHSDLAPTDNIATVVSSCFFFFIKIYLFMAVLGLHFCVRAFSSCGKWGPLFITVRGPLIIALSLIAEHRLQTRRLSNCGSQAQLLCDMWDPPRPGLEPVSPALAGRFSTTAPPGKPQTSFDDAYNIYLLFFSFSLLPSYCRFFSSFILLDRIAS